MGLQVEVGLKVIFRASGRHVFPGAVFKVNSCCLAFLNAFSNSLFM